MIEKQLSKEDGIEVELGKLGTTSPKKAGREGAIQAHAMSWERAWGITIPTWCLCLS